MQYALLNTQSEILRVQDFATSPPLLSDAKGLHWVEYVDTPQPAFDAMTQRVEAAAPIVDTAYTAQWEIVELDAETITAKQTAFDDQRIARLWQAAHDYEYAQISGTATVPLTVGVLQQLPKALAIKDWCRSIWNTYYTRRANGSTDYSFANCGLIPHSIPELLAEVEPGVN